MAPRKAAKASPTRRARGPSALDRLAQFPRVVLGHYPTPLDELERLRAALPKSPRLFVKRDDAIPFAFGGNKVRKLEMVAARALADGADTLITVGGVRSNHARATAAAAARLGLKCVLIINGAPPAHPTGNALLDRLVGAEIEYVGSREERVPAMRRAAERLQAAGRHPFEVPLGASTPLGALGYVRAVAELAGQDCVPDVVIVASSSGGTLAGLRVGAEILGLATRFIGVSPDDPASAVAADVARISDGIRPLLGMPAPAGDYAQPAEVDDRFVGEGYGIPTPASREAIELVARSEGLMLDPTYTAKAMAALIAYVRAGRFTPKQTVLFWHTGGQVELVAGGAS